MAYNLQELKKLSFFEIAAIASDNKTETETLSQIIELCLQKDKYDDIDKELDDEGVDEIFSEIAWNPNASADILRLLSNYDSDLVHQRIAFNINTTADVLAKLTEDEDELVQSAVAANNNTPSDSLDFLSDVDDKEIREAVANNPHTNSQTLFNMASNPSENCGLVFEGIALNANSDTKTLSVLAEDEYRYIHKGIGKSQIEAIYEAIKNNKNSSSETVKKAENYLKESEKTRFNDYFYRDEE